MVDTATYRAAGLSLAGCERFVERSREVRAAWKAFADELGAMGWTSVRGVLVGLGFDKGVTPDPNVWRQDKDVSGSTKVYAPRRNNAAGKALDARFKALPHMPTAWDVHEYVGVPAPKNDIGVLDGAAGRVYARCSLEQLGDHEFLIEVKFNEQHPLVAPTDAVELKTSEAAALRVSRAEKKIAQG